MRFASIQSRSAGCPVTKDSRVGLLAEIRPATWPTQSEAESALVRLFPLVPALGDHEGRPYDARCKTRTKFSFWGA
jgi:hypothetical protein